MQDVNDAYKAIKFGYFHVKLLCVAFVGTIANVLVTGTTAYLLPSAECDLNMNLIKKGFLNAMPYVGKFFKYFWYFHFISFGLCHFESVA